MPSKTIPLIVDFDGTMQLSDLTLAGLVWILKKHPLSLPKLLLRHLTQGRAAMKLLLQDMAEVYDWNPALPWEERVLDYIAEEKAKGRTVVIVTGSTTRLVKRAIAGKGLEYEVVGTESAHINLTGPRKAAALVEKWGLKQFDYIGNSRDDLAVWKESRYAMVVNAKKRVQKAALKIGNVAWSLERPRRKPLPK